MPEAILTHYSDRLRFAPNGRVSNLSPELWDYVRTPEFKEWFGDWENDPEHASKVLDANGEPLLVWHGSNRDFEVFDLSKGGKNTGGGEWTDKLTGEKVMDDATKAMFFSSLRDQGASYAILAKYNEFELMRYYADGMVPIFRAVVNYDFKDRASFMEALSALAAVEPALVPFRERIEASPGRKIMEQVRDLPGPERESLEKAVTALRDKYRERTQQMYNGGISNMVHTYSRMVPVVDSLKRDMDRLRRNDLTVPNEFGTFESYNEIIPGAGYDSLSITNNREDGRIEFHGQGMHLYLDEADDRVIRSICELMDRYIDEGTAHANSELDRYGFDEGANLYGCFLNIRNPFPHDYEGSAMPDKYKQTRWTSAYIAARQVRRALADGADGVVYLNVRDPFLSDSYGVFDASQVRIVEHGHTLKLENPAEGRALREMRFLVDWFCCLTPWEQGRALSFVTPADGTDRMFLEGWAPDKPLQRNASVSATDLFRTLSPESLRNVLRDYRRMQDDESRLYFPGTKRWFASLTPRGGVYWALAKAVLAGAGDGVKAVFKAVCDAAERNEDIREAAKGFDALPAEDRRFVMRVAKASYEEMAVKAFTGRWVVLHGEDEYGRTLGEGERWKAVRAVDSEGRSVIPAGRLVRLDNIEPAGSARFCEACAMVFNRLDGTVCEYLKPDGTREEKPASTYVMEAVKSLPLMGERVFSTKEKADSFHLGGPVKMSFYTDASLPFLDEAVTFAGMGLPVEVGGGGKYIPSMKMREALDQDRHPGFHDAFRRLVAPKERAQVMLRRTAWAERMDVGQLRDMLSNLYPDLTVASDRDLLLRLVKYREFEKEDPQAYRDVLVSICQDISNAGYSQLVQAYEKTVAPSLKGNAEDASGKVPLMVQPESAADRERRRAALVERDRMSSSLASVAGTQAAKIDGASVRRK